MLTGKCSQESRVWQGGRFCQLCAPSRSTCRPSLPIAWWSSTGINCVLNYPGKTFAKSVIQSVIQQRSANFVLNFPDKSVVFWFTLTKVWPGRLQATLGSVTILPPFAILHPFSMRTIRHSRWVDSGTRQTPLSHSDFVCQPVQRAQLLADLTPLELPNQKCKPCGIMAWLHMVRMSYGRLKRWDQSFRNGRGLFEIPKNTVWRTHTKIFRGLHVNILKKKNY